MVTVLTVLQMAGPVPRPAADAIFVGGVHRISTRLCPDSSGERQICIFWNKPPARTTSPCVPARTTGPFSRCIVLPPQAISMRRALRTAGARCQVTRRSSFMTPTKRRDWMLSPRGRLGLGLSRYVWPCGPPPVLKSATHGALHRSDGPKLCNGAVVTGLSSDSRVSTRRWWTTYFTPRLSSASSCWSCRQSSTSVSRVCQRWPGHPTTSRSLQASRCRLLEPSQAMPCFEARLPRMSQGRYGAFSF
eukprot:SAG11_NODE_2143_length_3754_cov_22.384405_1_plen_247_part_00